MSKFKTNIGPVVKDEKLNDETLPNTKLYKDYYDIESGNPIALDKITKRVKRRIVDIEKNSKLLCLDLFFIHQNFKTFYKREESFSKYLRDEIQLSRTYAYNLINTVHLLHDYFQYKGNKNEELSQFLDDITNTIEELPIRQLINISAIKDDKERFQLVDQLMDGDSITITKTPKPKKMSKVKLVGQELKVGKEVILTLQTEDEKLIKAIIKTVDRYYS